MPYITAPGRTVRTVVSDHGVYEKEHEDGAFMLTGVFGDQPEAQAVEVAPAACGWDLAVAARLKPFESPTSDELTLIHDYPPNSG